MVYWVGDVITWNEFKIVLGVNQCQFNSRVTFKESNQPAASKTTAVFKSVLTSLM